MSVQGSGDGSFSIDRSSFTHKVPKNKRDKNEISSTDAKILRVGKTEFAKHKIGTIQHAEHGHVFGDYLIKTCSERRKVQESREGLTEELSDLELCGALVTKYDYHPADVDLDRLMSEVDEVLALEEEDPLVLQEAWQELSHAQRIVVAASCKNEDGQARFSSLAKIKANADQMVRENDGFILPGGTSIHPKFYGEMPPKDEIEDYDESVPRSVMEFCIIGACNTQGRPLIGVCRGHQAIGVYHGGRLDRENIGMLGHERLREIISIKREDGAQGIVKDMPNTVFFSHYQILKYVGQELESIVKLNVGEELLREYQRLEETLSSLTELIPTAIYNVNTQDLGLEEDSKNEIKEILELLQSRSVVLAMESKFGVPIIGLQFHPEAVEIADRICDEEATLGQGDSARVLPERKLDLAGNRAIIENFIEIVGLVEKKRAVLAAIKELHRD